MTEDNSPSEPGYPKPTTDALPTPPVPRISNHLGQKIDDLRLGPEIIRMLAQGYNVNKIQKELNEMLAQEGVGFSLSYNLVRGWIDRQGAKIQEIVRRKEESILKEQVWQFERDGIELRKSMQSKMKSLLDQAMNKEVLNVQDLKDIATICEKMVRVQESGEKFIGIGGKDGNRFNLQVNVNVDVADKIKAKRREREKANKTIDVKVKPVEWGSLSVYVHSDICISIDDRVGRSLCMYVMIYVVCW